MAVLSWVPSESHSLPRPADEYQPKIDWSKKCALFGLTRIYLCLLTRDHLIFSCSWYVNNLLSLLEHQNPLPQVPFLPIIQREKMLHTQRGTNNNCYCYWNGHKKPEILFASVMHWTLSILSYICIVLYWLEFLLRSAVLGGHDPVFELVLSEVCDIFSGVISTWDYYTQHHLYANKWVTIIASLKNNTAEIEAWSLQ